MLKLNNNEKNNNKHVHIYFGATTESEAVYPDSAEIVTLRGWFLKHDSARLLGPDEALDATTESVKIGVKGPDDTLGVVAGLGVAGRAKKEAQRIRKFLSDNPSFTMTLLLFGFSRGGVSALLLSKELSDIDPERLTIHALVLDPVPGNLRSTQKMGIGFGKTLTKEVIDLSKCSPLRDVLCLYAQEQGTPNASSIVNNFFSRIAPKWPLYENAFIEEDVYDGDHTIFWGETHANENFDCAAMNFNMRVIYRRCFEFMIEHGYSSKIESLTAEKICPFKMMLISYEDENARIHTNNEILQKTCHSNKHEKTRIITTREKYYNLHHKSLMLGYEIDEISNEDCSLRVQRIALRLNFDNEFDHQHLKEALIGFCSELHTYFLNKNATAKQEILEKIITKFPKNNKFSLGIILVLVIALGLQQDKNHLIMRKMEDYGSAEEKISELLNSNWNYVPLKIFIFSTLTIKIDEDDNIKSEHLYKFALTEKNDCYFKKENNSVVYATIGRALDFLLEEHFLETYEFSFFQTTLDDTQKFSQQIRPNQRRWS